MSQKKFWQFVASLAAAGLLVFLVFYGWRVLEKVNNTAINLRVAIYARLSFVGHFVSEIKKTKTLIEENTNLREENQTLISRLAYQEQLAADNDFLREALRLPAAPDKKLTDAGVYNVQFSPEGYYVLVNKGSGSGIKEGDIVILSSGVLVGMVDRVFNNYSRVSTVMNSDFKATVKVLSKNISGIAVGAMGEGLHLDFISQNDEISEGDIITTTGNDIFPSGLIAGKVTTIKVKDGSLFKDVTVEPALKQSALNKVLIISK